MVGVALFRFCCQASTVTRALLRTVQLFGDAGRVGRQYPACLTVSCADVWGMPKPGSLPAEVTAMIDQLQASPRGGTLAAAPLWMDASWRAAQQEGISAAEFAKWVEVGVWNLAGDPVALTAVGIFRGIAGADGWLLAKAQLDPMEALRQYQEHGAATVLETAEVLTALTRMSEDVPPEHRALPVPGGAVAPVVRGPLNFG